MSFWLYDPMSFKDSALFPTGGLGNFLNTLTILLIGVITAIKTKYQNIADDTTLIKYGGIALFIILATGLLLCDSEKESEQTTSYNFDLSYE